MIIQVSVFKLDRHPSIKMFSDFGFSSSQRYRRIIKYEHSSSTFDDMGRYFILNRLYKELIKNKDYSYANEEEKKAVSVFLKGFKFYKRLKKNNRKSNEIYLHTLLDLLIIQFL